jgi:hypothetical protein
MATETRTVDTQDLERRVKEMYREVADEPHKDFHFETGRALAERLGYPPAQLDAIPSEAIESFAGVGRDDYRDAIESAGFEVHDIKENDQYRFVSERADDATRKYGVKSVSLLAFKS